MLPTGTFNEPVSVKFILTNVGESPVPIPNDVLDVATDRLYHLLSAELKIRKSLSARVALSIRVSCKAFNVVL